MSSKSVQDNRTKNQIAREVTNDVKNMGLTDDEFEVRWVKEGDMKGNKETSIQITFGVKGNKKIIDSLTSKGWQIDRRYRNDDGNPSVYSSDIHGGSMLARVTMIVMKYPING